MGGREVLRPRIRRKQPARPLTGQPEQGTREPSPRSRSLTVLACLPKNAPCISISRPFLSCTRRSPPRLPSAALWALILSFPAPCLPEAGRKAHRQEGAGGVGAPTRVPRSPLPAEPSSRTLGYGNECHLDGVPRVRGSRPRLREPLCGFRALPQPPPPSSSLCPPPGLGSTPRSPRPRPFHFLSRSGLQQNTGQREGQKVERRAPFGVAQPARQLPLPSPDPLNPNCNFFPSVSVSPWLRRAGAGRRAARRGAGGRAAARLRVAVRARAASRRVGGWVGREEGRGRAGREWGVGKGRGRGREGGGDSALLPLPAGAGGGGRRPRGGRGGGRRAGRGREGGSRGRRSDNPCVS